MRKRLLMCGVLAIAMQGGIVLAEAQVVPPTTPKDNPILDEAQKNVAMAQVLYQLGTTQARVVSMQSQIDALTVSAKAKDEYWHKYVMGLSKAPPSSTTPPVANKAKPPFGPIHAPGVEKK